MSLSSIKNPVKPEVSEETVESFERLNSTDEEEYIKNPDENGFYIAHNEKKSIFIKYKWKKRAKKLSLKNQEHIALVFNVISDYNKGMVEKHRLEKKYNISGSMCAQILNGTFDEFASEYAFQNNISLEAYCDSEYNPDGPVIESDHPVIEPDYPDINVVLDFFFENGKDVTATISHFNYPMKKLMLVLLGQSIDRLTEKNLSRIRGDENVEEIRN